MVWCIDPEPSARRPLKVNVDTTKKIDITKTTKSRMYCNFWNIRSL